MIRRDLILAVTCATTMTLAACSDDGGDDVSGFPAIGSLGADPGGETVPVPPVTTNPELPGTGDVGTPGTGDVGMPGTGDVEVPDTGDVEVPDTGDVEPPGTGDTEMPGTGDVGMPGTGDAEMPGTGDAEMPGTGDVGMPGTGDVEPPGTSEGPSEDDPVSGFGPIADLFGRVVIVYRLTDGTTTFALDTVFGPADVNSPDGGSAGVLGEARFLFANADTGDELVEDGTVPLFCTYQDVADVFLCTTLIGDDETGLTVNFLFDRPVDGRAEAVFEVCAIADVTGTADGAQRCASELLETPDGVALVSIQGSPTDASTGLAAGTGEPFAGLSVGVNYLHYDEQASASIEQGSTSGTRARTIELDLAPLWAELD